MIFHFKIEGDNLEMIPVKEEAYTGNVNTYTCLCEFDEAWDSMEKFAVFTDGEKSYAVIVPEDRLVKIPNEAVVAGKLLRVGFFGDSLSETDFRRISTGLAEITVKEGAYTAEKTSPEIPEPDLWERLVNRNIPQLGGNGNWWIWDITAGEYRDSGVSAVAGAEQIKGEILSELEQSVADGVAEKIESEVKPYIEEKLVDITVPEAANSFSVKAEFGTAVAELEDVSPIPHTVSVKLKGRNLVKSKALQSGGFIVSDDGRTISVDTDKNNGWYSNSYHIEDYIPRGSAITVSVGEYTCDKSLPLRVHLQDVANTVSTYVKPFDSGTINGKYVIHSTDCDIKDIFVSVDGRPATATIKDLQIEYGTEATEYSPHLEQGDTVTITEEKGGTQREVVFEGMVELEAHYPDMRIITDKGAIEWVCYNKDSVKLMQEFGEGIEAVGDETAQNTQDISRVLASIAALQESAGFIYHDWYYPNGGAGAYTATIGKDDYGLFAVMSSGSTVSYTSGNGVGAVSLSGQAHIFIKTLNSNGQLHTMWHIITSKGTLGMPSVESKQYYPITDISITNNSTSSGMNVIRIPLRSPK